MNETVAHQYKLLSLCFHKPEGPLFLALKETDQFRQSLDDTTEATLQSEYTRLFSLTVAGGIPPYETEYGHKDIFFKTQALADIAGFYRAFGMEISDQVKERVDFIGAELDLMYWLTLKEEYALGPDEGPSGRERDLSPIQARIRLSRSERIAICGDAATKFLEDHLGRWGSYFGDQLAKSTTLPFYRLIGKWLCELIESECNRLGIHPDRVTGWAPDPEESTGFECGADQK